MKGSTWRVVVIALAAFMLCACGKKSNLNPKDPANISIWNYYSGSQLQKFNAMVERFNETRGRELGIVVESKSEGTPEDLKRLTLDAANHKVGAEKLPDIISVYRETVYTLDAMGLVVNMQPYFTEKEIEEYIEGYLKEGDLHHNGELKIFPVAKATEILMLNESYWNSFAKATGRDLTSLSTMEGLVETAKAYYEWTDQQTEVLYDGKALFGRDAMANYMNIGARQLGTEIVHMDENGEVYVELPKEVARKLWDNYYVPYVSGYFAAKGRFRSEDVKTGEILCYVGSSASASFFPQEVILGNDSKYPITVSVLEAPKFAGGENWAIQQGAGMAVLSESEKNREACAEFLRWFTEKENNIQFSVKSGYLPVKKAASNMEEISKVEGDTEALYQSLQVSIDTVNQNQMHIVAGQDMYIRPVLDHSLSDAAVKAREGLLEELAFGAVYEEALQHYLDEPHFDAWYAALMQELEEAVRQTNEENGIE